MSELQAAETQAADAGTEAMNAALAGIGESPMEPAQTETAATEPAAPVWNGEEWKFKWGDKEIVPDSRDKVMTWASQGYNYSQRMGELNKTHTQRMQEAEAREAKAREIEEKFGRYAPLEEFANKNPGWIEHVNQAYQQKLAQEKGIDPNLAQALTPLQQKLEALEAEQRQRQEIEAQQKLEAQHQEEDKALDAEVQATRKLPEFANITWDQRDESGETLETRICKHGIDNKIQSFKAAARDYLFPQLLTQHQAQSKLTAVRGQQAQAKAGVLGQTQAPTKELKRVDPKLPWSDPAYSDIGAILQEYRQINGG